MGDTKSAESKHAHSAHCTTTTNDYIHPETSTDGRVCFHCFPDISCNHSTYISFSLLLFVCVSVFPLYTEQKKHFAKLSFIFKTCALCDAHCV